MRWKSVTALGLLLALFDFGTLQGLALLASFLKPSPLIRSLRWLCLTAVLGLAVLVLLVSWLPQRWRRWLQASSMEDTLS